MKRVQRVITQLQYSGARLHSTSATNLPRPFRFFVGTSFAGKPSAGRSNKRGVTRFPATSEVARWVREQMSVPKKVASVHAGEDAFFVQPMKNKSGVALGVADGVGGWIDSGVDPSLFSQSLMFHAHRYAKRAWAGESDSLPGTEETDDESSSWELTPEECMSLAYGAVLRDKAVLCGSSTACIATFNTRNGMLRAANLGDSGFTIIRNGAILRQQPHQTHYFNCPRQLSKLGPFDKEDSIVDLPSDADSYSATLRHGDMVVFYTDGVSDNVWPHELLSLSSLVLRSVDSEEQQAQEMADQLVEWSRMCMYRRNKVSPFEHEARREGAQWAGGKEDDATALVVVVSESGDAFNGIV